MGGEEGDVAVPPAAAVAFVDEEDQEVRETLLPYSPAPVSAAGYPLCLRHQPLTPPPPSVAPAPASSASALAARHRRLPTPPPTSATHSASAIACPGELPMSHGARARGGGALHGAAAGVPACLGRSSQWQTRVGEGIGWRQGGGDHGDGRPSGTGDGSRRIEVTTDRTDAIARLPSILLLRSIIKPPPRHPPPPSPP